MLNELGNDLKKVLLAGIGAAAVTVEKSEGIIKELIKKGALTVEQGKTLNEELKHKTKKETKEECSSCETYYVDLESLTPEERTALKYQLEELEKNDKNRKG